MPAYCRPDDDTPAVMMDLHHLGVTMKMIELEAEIAVLVKKNRELREALSSQIRSNNVSNGIMQDALK